MMFTCATPGCTDPRHDHPDAPHPRACAPRTAARAAASTKVIRGRRGKSLRIDIHCHYLNQAVAAKVAHLNPAQYEPSVTYRQRADPRGQRGADPRPVAKAHVDRDAPRGHGSHGHRHAGGVARAEPVLLLDRPGAGRRTVAHGERSARRDRRDLAGALCRARNRAAAARRSRGRRARALREATRPARGGNQPQRQRHGPHGPAAEPGEVLRQGAGARRRHLHASDRLHARRASASTTTSTT